jgi:hypothetical protein
VGGLGQTDGSVFPSAEVFDHRRLSRGKDQRDPVTRHSQGDLDMHHPGHPALGPLSGAVETPLGPHQVNVLSL